MPAIPLCSLICNRRPARPTSRHYELYRDERLPRSLRWSAWLCEALPDYFDDVEYLQHSDAVNLKGVNLRLHTRIWTSACIFRMAGCRSYPDEADKQNPVDLYMQGTPQGFTFKQDKWS